MLRDWLPQVAAVFGTGMIDTRMVATIIAHTENVDDEVIARLDTALARHCVKWMRLSGPKLTDRIDLWVAKFDPAGVRIPPKVDDKRYVEIAETSPGMAGIWANIHATDAEAFDKRIDALAATVCENDPRTKEQRRADACGALARLEERLECQCGVADCAAAAERNAVNAAVIHVLAEQPTIDGTGDHPGYLPGFGTQAQAIPARARGAGRGEGGEAVLMAPTTWHKRVDSGDWDSITAEVNDFGGALLPRLLTPTEAATIRQFYPDDAMFRATIDMSRYRFGEGEYRYFRQPYPEPIEQLKQALYPRLLPIAREWWAKLGRNAPWPDTLDDWLDMCRAAGQRKSTAILLKYGPGDWNALHRDLYGDLVFPLQVVINLSDPGVDHTGGEFLVVEQRPRAQSRGTATLLPHGHGFVFTTRERPCGPVGDGRRPRCGTGSPRSAPASASRSVWCSTTPHET